MESTNSPGSSPAPEAAAPPAVTGQSVLETLTPTQRDTWQQTGELPEPSDASAESSPAEPVDQAASSDAVPPSKAETPKGKGVKARSAELDREIADLNEKLRIRRELHSELAKVTLPEKQDARPASSPAPVTTSSDPEPNPEDTTTYPDGQFDRQYLKDQARWEARAEFRAQQTEAQKSARETAKAEYLRERQAAFLSRVEEVSKADPEFLDKVIPEVLQLKTVHAAVDAKEPLSALNALADEFLEHPKGPQLMVYFSAHPAELRRFGAMTPPQFHRELGRLEASIDAPAMAPLKTTTDAPAPPLTLGKKPSDPADEAEAAIARGDTAAYIRVMNARELAARK